MGTENKGNVEIMGSEYSEEDGVYKSMRVVANEKGVEKEPLLTKDIAKLLKRQ